MRKLVAGVVPAQVLHMLYSAAQNTFILWRRILPRKDISCFVAIGNARHEILLVKHSYRDQGQWTIPGGHMKKGESPIDAARREVREELSCELSDVELKGFFHWVVPPRDIEGYVITAITKDVPRADGQEIVEAGFFPLDGLPPLTHFAEEQIEDLIARTSFAVKLPPYVRPEFVAKMRAAYARHR